MKENDPLSELKAQREVHDLVSELLDSLLYEQGNRLLIIIDELDRCKPEYSVRLLERIKHYFANERITYVFAVNIEELQHTVRSFYGEGFDACRYLDRFFDYRIALPPANTTRYYQQLGLENGSWVYESVCRAVIDYCDFGIREIDKFYRTVKSQRTTPRITIVTLVFSDGNALQFGLCVVVPIIIGLRMYNMELYNDFIGGNNPEPLISILGEGDVARGLCSMLIDRQKETYDNSLRGDENKAIVRLPDRLQLIYEALFKDIARPRYAETHIGECSFSRQTKETIIRTASMLSEFARFD